MGNKTIVTFALDIEEDRDILRWLDRQTNCSAAIRAAIRGQTERSVSLADVYQAVQAIERKMATGVMVQTDGDGDNWDEPSEAAAALDALAEL